MEKVLIHRVFSLDLVKNSLIFDDEKWIVVYVVVTISYNNFTNQELSCWTVGLYTTLFWESLLDMNRHYKVGPYQLQVGAHNST